MISEPEIAEQCGSGETREVVGDLTQVRTGRQAPWPWALGGVLAASVLWTTAILLHGVDDRKPDTLGYDLTRASCASMRLHAISAAITPGKSSITVANSGLLRHAALDQVQCVIALEPKAEKPRNGWSTDYAVAVKMTLHKESDPAVEFEAERRVTNSGIVSAEMVRAVPNLGTKAYLVNQEASTVELRVLDGGAVLSMSLSVSTQYQAAADDNEEDEVGDGPEAPELSEYEPSMISDMNELMARLKR